MFSLITPVNYKVVDVVLDVVDYGFVVALGEIDGVAGLFDAVFRDLANVGSGAVRWMRTKSAPFPPLFDPLAFHNEHLDPLDRAVCDQTCRKIFHLESCRTPCKTCQRDDVYSSNIVG